MLTILNRVINNLLHSNIQSSNWKSEDRDMNLTVMTGTNVFTFLAQYDINARAV